MTVLWMISLRVAPLLANFLWVMNVYTTVPWAMLLRTMDGIENDEINFDFDGVDKMRAVDNL